MSTRAFAVFHVTDQNGRHSTLYEVALVLLVETQSLVTSPAGDIITDDSARPNSIHGPAAAASVLIAGPVSSAEDQIPGNLINNKHIKNWIAGQERAIEQALMRMTRVTRTRSGRGTLW